MLVYQRVPVDIQAHCAKVTATRKHGRNMENVQLQLFVVMMKTHSSGHSNT